MLKETDNICWKYLTAYVVHWNPYVVLSRIRLKFFSQLLVPGPKPNWLINMYCVWIQILKYSIILCAIEIYSWPESIKNTGSTLLHMLLYFQEHSRFILNSHTLSFCWKYWLENQMWIHRPLKIVHNKWESELFARFTDGSTSVPVGSVLFSTEMCWRKYLSSHSSWKWHYWLTIDTSH